jgi:hypothetical protein
VAEFAVFFPDGEFAYVICLLGRDPGGGRVEIPARLDDFYVRRGTWLCHASEGATAAQDRAVTVTSRRTHGPQEDGPAGETVERWTTENPCDGLAAGRAGPARGPRHAYVPLASLRGLADPRALLKRLAGLIVAPG